MKVFCNVFVWILILLVSGCDDQQKLRPGRNYTGELLGKIYEIDIPGDTLNREALIDSVFTAFEQIFNAADSQSLLYKVNAFHRLDTVLVFNDTTRLFGIVYELAMDLWRITEHGWDPAIAPLKRNLIRSGNDAPISDSLLEACSFNESNIRMQEHFDENGVYKNTSVLKRNLLTELDFADIASALAVDYLAEAFVMHGIKAFRIKHDGDVKCCGLNGDDLAIIELGMGSAQNNPQVDIGNTAYSVCDATEKLSMVDPATGSSASGPIVYAAVAAQLMTEARIFSHAFMVKDLNSIAQYYVLNPESRVQSFLFFQRGDTLQNASTNGFDRLIISPETIK